MVRRRERGYFSPFAGYAGRGRTKRDSLYAFRPWNICAVVTLSHYSRLSRVVVQVSRVLKACSRETIARVARVYSRYRVPACETEWKEFLVAVGGPGY